MVRAMSSMQNPLLPAPYDLFWTGVVMAIAVLTLTALWQVLRSRSLTGLQSLAWFVIVLALPVLGATGWFILRPHEQPRVSA